MNEKNFLNVLKEGLNTELNKEAVNDFLEYVIEEIDMVFENISDSVDDDWSEYNYNEKDFNRASNVYGKKIKQFIKSLKIK